MQITKGYISGCVGDIISLNAKYYAKRFDLGKAFEIKIATDIAEFVASLGSGKRELFTCIKDGVLIGCIAVDEIDEMGLLRWFLVDDRFQNQGIGKGLLKEAIKFCDENFNQTYLYTNKELEIAIKMYEKFGFERDENFAPKRYEELGELEILRYIKKRSENESVNQCER
ncbi:GNAT family N-acetyltransferase [Campylobacter sp.]|uniref:GNAT family N-acetyltransferase n=1 Tax=Campylobacter sp. TaxID=205 RepID=UPI0026FEB755|nr:GNAT family N-acetyltransferase [Campylobacter sp.]